MNVSVCRFFGLAISLLMLASGAARAEALTLEAAVSEALSSNPDMAAIQARADALGKVPAQLDALPDPRLSLNIMNLPLDSFSLTQEGMSQLQIGFSQALPYPGKLALRAKVAGFEAQAATAETQERQLQLARDVRTVWWNLFYLARALEVVERNKGLLQQVINVAEIRYEVGKGKQQEILLAQLERSKLDNRTLQIHQLQQREAARLKLLLARSHDTPVVLAEGGDQPLPQLIDSAQLQALASGARPMLSAQLELSNAARSRVELAKADYAPDFMLGAVYGVRDGHNPDGSERADMGSIMFSMNLPFMSDSRLELLQDQRNAQWLQQKYQLQDQRNQVASQVSQAVADYHGYKAQSVLFQQQIIPQANQTVEASLAGYQVGKVDFLTLLRSQTTLYDYETQYWKAYSSAHQALARLMAAVGEETIYAQ